MEVVDSTIWFDPIESLFQVGPYLKATLYFQVQVYFVPITFLPRHDLEFMWYI